MLAPTSKKRKLQKALDQLDQQKDHQIEWEILQEAKPYSNKKKSTSFTDSD